MNKHVVVEVFAFDGRMYWFRIGSVSRPGHVIGQGPKSLFKGLGIFLQFTASDDEVLHWHVERIHIQLERLKRPRIVQLIQRLLRWAGSCEDEIIRRRERKRGR